MVDRDGHEIMTTPLLTGADFDENGDVSEEARPRSRKRLANVDRLLGAFGFRALDRWEPGDQNDRRGDPRRVERPGAYSINYENVIRLQRDGKLLFEKPVETTGTIGLRWGKYLSSKSLVLLAWTRRSGRSNDASLKDLEGGKVQRQSFTTAYASISISSSG